MSREPVSAWCPGAPKVAKQHGLRAQTIDAWRQHFVQRLRGRMAPGLQAWRLGRAGRVPVFGRVDRRCCPNPHWPARCPPTGFSPADAIRHWSAEGGHPIEDFAAEDYLTPLPGWVPGAKAISDDGLVSEERILHPALTMVP